MFYTQFLKICKARGVKPTPLIKELGFSSGNLKKWADGGSINAETLVKLSRYFDVPMDYFFEEDDAKLQEQTKQDVSRLQQEKNAYEQSVLEKAMQMLQQILKTDKCPTERAMRLESFAEQKGFLQEFEKAEEERAKRLADNNSPIKYNSALFFERFTALCKERRIKPSPLLRSFGHSATNLQKWSNGGSVTSDILVELANYFQVPIGYFFEDSNASNGSDKMQAFNAEKD